MLTSYAIGVLGTIGLALLWVAVQGAWRQSFQDLPGVATDPDVLAGRPGCNGCTHEPVCDRPSRTTPIQEETP